MNSDNGGSQSANAYLLETETTILQKRTEKECQPYFVDLSSLPDDQKRNLEQIGLLKEESSSSCDDGGDGTGCDNGGRKVQLLREKHMSYLEGVWKRPLKSPFVSLDSSRPWMLYWCLHGCDLLRSSRPSKTSSSKRRRWTDADASNMISTLEDCWKGYYVKTPPEIVVDSGDLFFAAHEDDKNRGDMGGGGDTEEGGGGGDENKSESESEIEYYCGGFGGGPDQMAHAATTYAAVLALCILATDEIEKEIDDNTKEDGGEKKRLYHELPYPDRAKLMLREIRIPLYRWMCSLQVPSTGGYRMHHDGEVDVRATYCVACCAKLLGLLSPKNCTGSALGRPLVVDFVVSCQTYEGGMGGEPYSEAHGGYTFCAVAALRLLGALDGGVEDKRDGGGGKGKLDVPALIGWLARRQMSYEGGFSGRSNKLVDGCYSFWQGGAVAIASSVSGSYGCCDANVNGDSDGKKDDIDNDDDDEDPWLHRYREQLKLRRRASVVEEASAFIDGAAPTASAADAAASLPFPLLYDVPMLERYILLCAQEIQGGLRDKPSKPRDFYHTCYNLSGLSIAQHCSSSYSGSFVATANSTSSSASPSPPTDVFVSGSDYLDGGFGDKEQTLLEMTHPCYNIRIDRVAAILDTNWESETEENDDD